MIQEFGMGDGRVVDTMGLKENPDLLPRMIASKRQDVEKRKVGKRYKDLGQAGLLQIEMHWPHEREGFKLSFHL